MIKAEALRKFPLIRPALNNARNFLSSRRTLKIKRKRKISLCITALARGSLFPLKLCSRHKFKWFFYWDGSEGSLRTEPPPMGYFTIPIRGSHSIYDEFFHDCFTFFRKFNCRVFKLTTEMCINSATLSGGRTSRARICRLVWMTLYLCPFTGMGFILFCTYSCVTFNELDLLLI